MFKFFSIFYFLIAIISVSFAQSIPFGDSNDSITTSNGITYPIFYYKPLGYDSINSPILWGIHGSNSSGTSPRNDLRNIADRRNALIVSPSNLVHGWGFTNIDTTQGDTVVYWGPTIFKEVYRHILSRENRDNMWVYMIGFSAGGQSVTRYMLLRQVFLDSIPIRMAVSSNPLFYSFCTDFLNGSCMAWPCGLGIPDLSTDFLPLSVYDAYFICNEHVIQYYNENYAILIGTSDNVNDGGVFAGGCSCGQGNSRYNRAQNFYQFSTSDAILRGTTLKWQYGEVPGVDHNQYLMYNTILAGDSMPLAERLLFETPYHDVPHLVSSVDFIADTTIAYFPNATINFTNTTTLNMNYYWNFGDSTVSSAVNPTHTYTYADTFTVTLKGYGAGCNNEVVKNKYITIIDSSSFIQLNSNNKVLKFYPNPSYGNITIQTSAEAIEIIEIYNCIGNKTDEIIVKGNNPNYIYNSKNINGLYFIKVKTKENVYTGKVVFR